MKEELISFETAKSAKEKGFNIPCNEHIFISNTGKITEGRSVHRLDWGNRHHLTIIPKYSRPSQSLLQQWLRDIHDIDIEINSNHKPKIDRLYEAVVYSELVEEESDDYSWFKTYEEALGDGLLEALKLIK